MSQPSLFPRFPDEPRVFSEPLPGTPHPRPLIAVDFGTGDALALHGPDGPLQVPKLSPVRGGRAVSDRFIGVLPILLEDADVVVEDPTVGSSGVEPEEIAKIVAGATYDLFTISGRAVKNYRKDHGLEVPEEDEEDGEDDVSQHAQAAEILYLIASRRSERLKRWKPNGERWVRIHSSVRPHDKRGYRDEESDRWMQRYPPFSELSPDLRNLLGNGTKSGCAEYSRARALPFAMALDEPGAETRAGYEKAIGLYDHGYPSFYRRATIELMQLNAKRLADVTRIAEVPPSVRKEAWKLTRRQIRQIYHILRQGT